MNFTCEKHILQAAVQTAARAASAKSPIAALEGILIEAEESSVRFTGYDLKKGIYTTIPADVLTRGSVVIGAKLLADITRSLPDDIVSLAVVSEAEVHIKCGKAEFTIICSPASEYPEIIPVDEGLQITVNQAKLRSMLSETLFAVSSNESRPVYTGALFELTDNRLRVVAVDGYRLALREETLDGENLDTDFIVPGAALLDAEKLSLADDENAVITVGAKQISFAFGETVLISRRLEGEFINVSKSVPTTFNTVITTEKSPLQRGVERLSLIIDEKIKNPLRCRFSDDGIELLCVTARGRAEDSVVIIGAQGPALDIGFNNRYLLDALKNAPAETVKICLGTPVSPCVIKPEDDSGAFLYMILPVRLSAN